MAILIIFTAALIATVHSSEEKPATPALPFVQYASPYAYGGVPVYGTPYLGGHALAYPVAPKVEVKAAPAAVAYAPAFVGAPAAAVIATVPAAPLAQQFHSQDEFGNLAYGYNDLHSVKQEVGNGYAGVTGAYQYVDAFGKLQTVNYVADALGFRVADSRLPVAPTYDGVAPVAPTYDGVAPVAPVYDGVAPEPVKDTPEVVAARAEHLAAFEKIAAEHSVEKRSPDAMHNTYAGFGHHYMPFKYGSGFYTPSLAKHSYKYDERYVAGYGPRAYNYMYRGY